MDFRVFTPQQQEDAVRLVEDTYGYTAEPRSASAIASLMPRASESSPCVAMVNTHPAKVLDRMTSITGHSIELPLQLTGFMARPHVKEKIDPTLPALRKIIMKTN
ncbi:MAG: hypothetical protein K2F72_02895 [Muribaculaceae bacterium]|nr:hypothetical protein [Muribaculaceae bacterium]